MIQVFGYLPVRLSVLGRYSDVRHIAHSTLRMFTSLSLLFPTLHPGKYHLSNSAWKTSTEFYYINLGCPILPCPSLKQQRCEHLFSQFRIYPGYHSYFPKIFHYIHLVTEKMLCPKAQLNEGLSVMRLVMHPPTSSSQFSPGRMNLLLR